LSNETWDLKEEDKSHKNKGRHRNRTTPDARCKIEAMAGAGKRIRSKLRWMGLLLGIIGVLLFFSSPSGRGQEEGKRKRW
jgi:hypothetical protein